MKLQTKFAVLILLSTALMVWYMHFREIDIPKKDARAELHAQVIERTAPSPYRYRILLPYAAQAMTKVLGGFFGYDRALLLAYGFLEAVTVVALILILYWFFCLFFASLPSLMGALIVNLSLVVALRDHYFQPWSVANAVAYAIGAFLLYREKLLAFAVVVFVAAFNRETSVLLPVMYLMVSAGRVGRRRYVFNFIILAVLWCIAYLLIRMVQGSAPYIYHVQDILRKNFLAKNLGFMVVNVVLFLGIFWIFAARGFKDSPPFIRRLFLLIPVYLPLVIVFGVWKEVRLLMPLYPVLIPAALSYLFPYGTRLKETK